MANEVGGASYHDSPKNSMFKQPWFVITVIVCVTAVAVAAIAFRPALKGAAPVKVVNSYTYTYTDAERVSALDAAEPLTQPQSVPRGLTKDSLKPITKQEMADWCSKIAGAQGVPGELDKWGAGYYYLLTAYKPYTPGVEPDPDAHFIIGVANINGKWEAKYFNQ